MLSFLRAVFRRAIADTAKSAAGYGLTLRAGITFCLGSATRYSRFGGKAVIDEWQVWLS